MFRKKQNSMRLKRNGFSPHPLFTTSIVGGQRKIVPLSIEKLNPADFDLQKQLDAGVPLKEVNCNLLSGDVTDNEIQQFNAINEKSQQSAEVNPTE